MSRVRSAILPDNRFVGSTAHIRFALVILVFIVVLFAWKVGDALEHRTRITILKREYRWFALADHKRVRGSTHATDIRTWNLVVVLGVHFGWVNLMRYCVHNYCKADQ